MKTIYSLYYSVAEPGYTRLIVLYAIFTYIRST